MPLSDLVGEISKTNKKLDIIEFCQSSVHLNIKLYPIQKFVLKLVFSIPLSDDISHDPIILRDKFNEEVVRIFNSEIEFLDFLYNEGYINSKEFDDPLTELYLIIGRRGTKTTLSSIISAYSIYVILCEDSPQRYFGLVEASEIGISICSNITKNASRQLRELSSMVYSSKWFQPFLVTKEPASDGFFLKTKKELNSKGSSLASGIGRIFVSVFAASPSVRGSANFIVISDEYAHFIDSEHSTKKDPLDKKLYEALTPSTSGFINPDGTTFGKSIFITSPNGKKGETWNVKKDSKGDKSVLVLNIPSWWINPKVSSALLRKMYAKSESSFWQEYGARFIEQMSTWINNINIIKASIDNKLGSLNANPSLRYHMAVDLALSADATAITMCHYAKNFVRTPVRFDGEDEINYALILDKEGNPLMKSDGVYVFDYIEYHYPDEGTLSIDFLIDRIYHLDKIFNPKTINYDQWSAAILLQLLTKRGIKEKKLLQINASQSSNTNLAMVFKTQLMDGRIAYPYDQVLLNQITNVKEFISGKYIKVEDPTGQDDLLNSMFKAVLACHNDPDKDRIINVSKKSNGLAVRKHNKKVSLKNRDLSRKIG